MTATRAAPEPGTSAPGRAADLDLFKTLLVAGMIVAHCIQLLSFRPTPAAVTVSETVNLITFSGFMLAFGWGVGLSRDRAKSRAARLRPVALLLGATWLSEIAFVALVDKKPVLPELWNILTLSRLYGWSEFLASFAVLYLVIAVARPALVAIGSRAMLLVPAVIACLAATAIVVSADVPGLATLVGTTHFASFPLLAYLPWFLIGIFYARSARPQLVDWGLAALASAAFAFHFVTTGALPGRFPPTALYVAGPALPLLCYVAFCRWAARRVTLPPMLLGAGRHVLAALLVSNLCIFGLRFAVGLRLGQWWWTHILAGAIFALVTAWAAALDRPRQGRVRTS